MAYVNMAHMPNPNPEHVLTFQSLNGGINLSELEYRLKMNESPEMKNMIWRDGVICGRDGQEWITSAENLGETYTMYERLYFEHLFAHIGNKLFYVNPKQDEAEFVSLYTGVPRTRGTFFQYYNKLYYKTAGAYICIEHSEEQVNGTVVHHFSASAVDGYVPVTVINASPSTGSGDLYQPENRIQAKKTIWYNAEEGVRVYQLPVKPVDSVASVTVDGAAKTEGTDYTVDLANGTVTFNTAPPVTNPPTNNTVVITYSKANPDAMSSIMDCPYAATYGGAGDLCVVFGGCPAQPNAFFWSGNNIAMDATYFPFVQYQFAGGADDSITGFGKQQSYLVVFKERSVGRAKMSTTDVDGRLTIDMPYTAINDKIGCDLPWTIQLIDNNLVWCNTEQGVHILKDSSYAYENNIECISTKIRGFNNRLSLIWDVRNGAVISSLDDSRHYWVCSGDHAWLWDYENSDYKNPSWYFFTNIKASAFASELDDIWHLNPAGRLTYFARSYWDYDGPIVKSYRFPAQNFGGYDRLKNINSVIIAIRPDTPSTAKVTYITDYETRVDLTDLRHLVWRLVPRNLTYRCLAGTGFGAPFRRRPMCRRVKHFAMRLENSVVGEDLSIISAQIFYNYQGRLR